ncbi:MAG: hypothetical protein IJR47_02175 [Clostridia bacterium]|nr:hypothetical protein [Clostridia bacterium]
MINSKLVSKQLDELFEAVLKLESLEECYAFFIDLCTVSELQSLSQRLSVAKLLKQKVTYNDVVKQTGASTATISRVKKCLDYGTGGYDIVLEEKK